MVMQFFSGSLWQLVAQADHMSQLILLLLLVMSIVCWSVFFYKSKQFRAQKKHLLKVAAHMYHVGTIDDLRLMADGCKGTTAGYFLVCNIDYLKSLVQQSAHQGLIVKLDIDRLNQLQHDIYYTIDEIVSEQESFLWLLSTSANVATLLGLLGTIWGLMHAFIDIGVTHSSDIAVIAPGIAEALTTTLVGLMVAIPAVIMCNYLQIQIRCIEQQLLALAQRFNKIVQATFM